MKKTPATTPQAPGHVCTRFHPYHTARASQMSINSLAYYGGAPYIETRLTRFPAEQDVDWSGDVSKGIVGRKARATLINHMGRIADKLNQYVFQTPPTRDGADATFLVDATATGVSLDDYMDEISRLITLHRWAWIVVDKPGAPQDDDGNPAPQTEASKAAAGDRVYWSHYEAPQVVDWKFEVGGALEWLIAEESRYVQGTPDEVAETMTVRVVWTKGKRVVYNKATGAILETYNTGLDFVPIFCVGTPSPRPYWADDVERIQRIVMDLSSAFDVAIFDSVFAQRVLPADALETLMRLRPDTPFDVAVGLTLSQKTPILESQQSQGTARFIQPTRDMEIIRSEIDAKVKDLREVVGLALQQESRDIASAEALSWMHLDPEAALRARARKLREAETKAVAMSHAVDKAFKVYEPKYAEKFDVSDFKADIETLISVKGTDLPDTAARKITLALIRRCASGIRDCTFTPEEWKAIEAEVAEMDFAPVPPTAFNGPGEQAPPQDGQPQE
jgi:hypothetical protein